MAVFIVSEGRLAGSLALALLSFVAMTSCSTGEPTPPIKPSLLASQEQSAMVGQTSLKVKVHWSDTTGEGMHGEMTLRYQAPDRLEVEHIQYDRRGRTVSRDVMIGSQDWYADVSPSRTPRYQKLQRPPISGPPSVGLMSLIHSPGVRITTGPCTSGQCYRVSNRHPILVGGGLRFAPREGPAIGDLVLISETTMLPAHLETSTTTGPGLLSVVVDYFDYGVPNVITPPDAA